VQQTLCAARFCRGGGPLRLRRKTALTTSNPLTALPAGYRPGYRLTLPHCTLALGGGALTILAVAIFGWLTWLFQGAMLPPPGTPVPLLEITLIPALVCVPLVLLHELIHALVYRLLGYQVRFGVDWRLPGAYVIVPRQYQRRSHLLVTALAPLLLLTLTSVPFLAVPNTMVVVAALSVLVGNTGGAIGDLYIVSRLLRLPRGTLLRDRDPQTTLVFEPQRREGRPAPQESHHP
jgi:hypothetical protein